MAWLQLTLETAQHRLEQVEDALLRAGAAVVTVQDAGDEPILEPLPGTTPVWPHSRISGLFAPATDMVAVRQVLTQTLEELPAWRLETVAERDWERAWMDDFHPMRFGRRLWVCPTDQDPPDPTAVNLRLDPGLAFGTGTHPTTALCLEWLDGTDLRAKEIIDYGCGSGILAIAAAKLGARRVWAVDIDPQALTASTRNAAGNQVTHAVIPVAPENLPATPVDVLLANILAGPLVALAPRFADLVKGQGCLVLSGLLVQQTEMVKTAFTPWFGFGPCRHREEWSLLQATRLGT